MNTRTQYTSRNILSTANLQNKFKNTKLANLNTKAANQNQQTKIANTKLEIDLKKAWVYLKKRERGVCGAKWNRKKKGLGGEIKEKKSEKAYLGVNKWLSFGMLQLRKEMEEEVGFCNCSHKKNKVDYVFCNVYKLSYGPRLRINQDKRDRK